MISAGIEQDGRDAAPAAQLRRGVEWPTLALAIVIYGGWLAITAWHAHLPGWCLAILGGWLIAWHGSLQHETIHGHPTGLRAIDGLLGAVPLSLWLPYRVYRRTHRAHHAAAHVTNPVEDPESRYLPPSAGPLATLVARAQATLAGRLLLGPVLTILTFLVAEAGRAWRRPGPVLREWIPHLTGVGAVVLWLDHCGFGLWWYALTFLYPGPALSLLRSFAEHRSDAIPGHRIAIVERAGPFALLFLNNNLHAAHHAAPGLAWYRLPAFHRRHRARLLADNGGLLYRGYGEVARRFLLRRHDRLIHPDPAGLPA